MESICAGMVVAFTTNSSFVFYICYVAFQSRRNSPFLRLDPSMIAPKLLWPIGVETLLHLWHSTIFFYVDFLPVESEGLKTCNLSQLKAIPNTTEIKKSK